jgi:hypothetical protein
VGWFSVHTGFEFIIIYGRAGDRNGEREEDLTVSRVKEEEFATSKSN